MGIGLLLLPGTAHAQYIPPVLAAAALSPILVLLLCGVLGIVAGSLRTAARHAGLVVAWVVLFLLAAYFVENDYVIWTPLALYAAHAVLVVVLIGWEGYRRFARRRGADRRGSG